MLGSHIYYKNHGIYYLDNHERNEVALAIVTRYACLKDPIGSIGSGLVSLLVLYAD